MAVRIEQVLSKDSILELYLNDIYLGYGSYGVAASSLNYFNKPLQELSLEEIAYLAALPKAPNNYHPTKNYNNAIERRNWVLNQMYLNGYISKEELKIIDNIYSSINMCIKVFGKVFFVNFYIISSKIVD